MNTDIAMVDKSFANMDVVILGLARQGSALARFLTSQGARVTISDVASQEKLAKELAAIADLPVTLALGGHPLSLLDRCDLLCLSGGVPPQIEIAQAAIARGISLSNDSLLTMQLVRQKGLGPLVAITGSSGKTTTTTLVGEMLHASGFTVHVGGNIGTPLIDRLDNIRAGDRIVVEMSSFQLELFDPAICYGTLEGVGPDVAAILNITPNHLDRHPNMAAYADAKLNLVRRQPDGAVLVLDADDPVTRSISGCQLSPEASAVVHAWQIDGLSEEIQGLIDTRALSLVLFGQTEATEQGAWLVGDTLMINGKAFCRRSELRLRGAHNVKNVLAAAAISSAVGATPEAIGEIARSFGGVAHRLEVVAEVGGVTWVNDSIATSPERAVAGLRSFDPAQNTLILLAGGKDKNLPWDLFVQEVVERVSMLIGFGSAGAMILDLVHEYADYARRKAPPSALVQRLDEAVELAARSAHPGTVVLLSPGGTSYDAYRDFEERGEHFRHLVGRYGELCLGREA
jgi:UDP-N-acetylmuramoylalanine--D-glutamate ligase